MGKVVKLNASADGFIQSAEVNVRDSTYPQPGAGLVQLLAVPGHEADTETESPPEGVYCVFYFIAMLFWVAVTNSLFRVKECILGSV